MYTLSGSDRRRKTMSTIDPPSKTIFLVRLIMDGRGIRKILAVNPNKRLILELQSPQLWRDSNNTSFECKHNLYSSVMSKEGGRSARPGRSVIAAKRWIATPLPSPPPPSLRASNRVSKRINWYSRGVPSARPRFILQDEGSIPAKLIIISIVSAPVSFPSIDRYVAFQFRIARRRREGAIIRRLLGRKSRRKWCTNRGDST